MGYAQAGEDRRTNLLSVVGAQAPFRLMDDLAELALEAPFPGSASRDERDAPMPVEVAGGLRLAIPLEVPRGCDGDDRSGRDLPRDDGRVVERTVVDGHVDTFLYEIHGPVGDHDLDDDIREAGEELPQPR